MILRTGDSRELEFRSQLSNLLGRDDEKRLSTYLWENHTDKVSYLDALEAICIVVGQHGIEAAHRILEHAESVKSPKHAREEMELYVWFNEKVKPHLQRASRCLITGGLRQVNERTANLVFEEVSGLLKEKLHEMYGDKHRAMIDGAVVTAFRKTQTGVEFDIPGIVRHLNREDPLAINAKASWL